jgi:hypothetical protein
MAKKNLQRESRAARVAEDWKSANGKPLLSAEQSHNLAARIVEATVSASRLCGQCGFRLRGK